MKVTHPYDFNEDDEQSAELFFKLGIPKNLAKTLIFISRVGECQSMDIEHGAQLRQPEVSMATQELQTRGWIVKRDIKGEGKGRPSQVFKKALDISTILKNLEQEKLKEFEESKMYITKLENLLNKSGRN